MLLSGCTHQTAIELSLSAPASPTSVDSGVAFIEFITSHQSFCDRWVKDRSASGTTIPVGGRNLATSPYRLLVVPSQMTDLTDPVFAVALALDASMQVIGVADFGEHPFKRGAVDQYPSQLALFARTDASYVSDDGCVCIPGLPFIGNDPARDCDANVVTSFARLADTAGCELAPGRRELTAPVCDGHLYSITDEVKDRAMPCFVRGDQGCKVVVRNCADHDGLAYDAECVAGAGDPTLPSTALCDAYAGCEKGACADLVGCFLQAVPPAATIHCTMKVDPNPADGKTVQPCGTSSWEAVLPTGGAALAGPACVASIIDGTRQRNFTLGLKSEDTATMGAQTRSKLCPPTLVFDGVDVASPADVPDTLDVTLTIGDQVVAVQTTVVRDCSSLTPSLECHL
jgi:hypothetical protein